MSIVTRALCAAGLATLLAVPAAAQEYSGIGAEGALKVPSFTLPQSSLISPEMRRAYAEQLRDMQTWPRPPAMDAPIAEWQKFRKAFDDALQIPLVEKLKQRYPVDIRTETIGGVRTDVVTPKEGVAAKNKDRVLINLHGGAFYLGGGGPGGLLESIPVAGLGKIKVVSVDYRMAPEHKFPAASEDVAAVYQELLKRHKPENIGIYGCSAGGALAAQSMAWFQKHSIPRPAAVGIFCASAGGGRGDSAIWDTSGLLVVPAAAAPGAPAPAPAGYMSNADPQDPLARPIVSPAVLAKFPSTLLVTGTRAGEMSSAILSHAALLKAGVESQLYLIEGGWHGFFMGNQQIPEARDAVAYIVKWFDAHLGKSPS